MPLRIPKGLTRLFERFFKESTQQETKLEFYPLDRQFRAELSQFDCGDDGLNLYARGNCFQDEKRGLSRTYLGFHNGELVSFFSVSCGEIGKGSLPNARKPYPVYPVLRLGRLAVDNRFKLQGYGTKTIEQVFLVYTEVLRFSGAIALVVDAYPEAANFYRKFGFEELLRPDSETISMYVLTQTIRGLIE